jgi:hypothetical protein
MFVCMLMHVHTSANEKAGCDLEKLDKPKKAFGY